MRQKNEGKTTMWGNKDQTKINYQYENQLIFDLAAKYTDRMSL